VPFPAALEVILMEISFELLREAGVRLPGAMGNTIGIVGGLIIGQAAVDANLVSPIVVIVVAFTALCSFSIPNEEFAFSFRILKFYVIVLSAWLGFFGFLIALLTVFIHLSRLESFGIPYLMPFVGADVNDYHYYKKRLAAGENDVKDELARQYYTSNVEFLPNIKSIADRFILDFPIETMTKSELGDTIKAFTGFQNNSDIDTNIMFKTLHVDARKRRDFSLYNKAVKAFYQEVFKYWERHNKKDKK
jgi:hypothetical protein